MSDVVWSILTLVVSAIYAILYIALIGGFVFAIVRSFAADRIISKVTMYITCIGGIGITVMLLLYLIGSSITVWFPGASDYFNVFGNTLVEMAFVLMAIYHTACVVQKAKDSDLDREHLCLGVQLALILLAVFTVVVGAFPAIVLGIINFAVVTGPGWYQWIWMVVFTVDIVAIAIISTAFYVAAISNDVKQKSATTLLYMLCLIFVICAALALVLNLADTIFSYFNVPGAYPVQRFIVLVTNRLWFTLLLAGYVVIFLPWINRTEGLFDV